jgi:uncharacterized low-complexity protein
MLTDVAHTKPIPTCIQSEDVLVCSHPIRNTKMSKQTSITLMSVAGAVLFGSLAMAGAAHAGDNPFGHTPLNGSYLQVAMEEGKCGEAKKEAGEEGKPEVTQEAGENSELGNKETKRKTGKGGKCGSAKCGANKGKH